jgi:hypothetical protein
VIVVIVDMFCEASDSISAHFRFRDVTWETNEKVPSEPSILKIRILAQTPSTVAGRIAIKPSDPMPFVVRNRMR